MRIKGLDYIRVLGIFLVVFYHFFSNFIPGGFLGVNILFVLSGFLITYHLLDEIYKNKEINIRKFYYKRFVRIFPPVLLMVFLTSLTCFFINKDYSVRFFDQFISAITFNYNIFEIVRGGSYEGQFIRQLFMPIWSLAIEVHFYLLWPLVLTLIVNKFKNIEHFEKKYSSLLMKICICLYFISYLLMIFLVISSKDKISFVYFYDFTRMGSFIMGAFVGCFVKRFSYKQISYLKPTAIFSVILLVFSFIFSYNNKSTYILAFILTDFITALMILVSYSNKNIEEKKIINKLSMYSYGIFIFHWPSFVIITSIFDNFFGVILAVLVTALLVLVNFHLFEPLFNGKDINLGEKFFNNKKIIYENNKMIIQIFLVLIFSSSITMAYILDKKADDMVSIEKTILEKSIKQDIDKIKMDKNLLDMAIKKSENKEVTNENNDVMINVLADSVLLGNREMIQENIPNIYVNAEGSRPIDSASELINQMKKEGKLGSVVVIALGTNAIKDPKESLEEIIKAIPQKTRLIFVTCYDNRYKQPHRVSVAMREISKKYDFITLMDWEKEAMAHPEYYSGTDGVHYFGRLNVYDAYLKMLKNSIDQSLKNKAK